MEKHFVFITSTGRTGTKFMGDILSQMINGAFSVHEPDVLSTSISENISKVREFGFKHMVVDRIKGKTGIRNLSQQYVSGAITDEEAWQSIMKHRWDYWQGLPEDLIIESYTGWYGLLPVIKKNLKDAKIAVITRHAADWLRSVIQWGTLYGDRDWVLRLGQERLSPQLIGDEAHQLAWKEYDQFEKSCWMWNTLNSILFREVDGQECRHFKYEDLFGGRPENFAAFLKFICVFPTRSFNFKVDEKLITKRVHENRSDDFPSIEEWSEERKKILHRHCGELMAKLNYTIPA